MFKNEIKNYQALNELADQNGLVIFGGTEDRKIPLCELKQAFDLESNLYNRSISNLSIDNAVEIYDACIAPLAPERLLLHIGNADLELFSKDSEQFDKKYRDLIHHIKSDDPKNDIAIISLKNHNEDANVTTLNKHLKYIADSERCEYGDIAAKRVWNPKQTKDIVSFVYSSGLLHPLNNKRPIYDLAIILFCFEPEFVG